MFLLFCSVVTYSHALDIHRLLGVGSTHHGRGLNLNPSTVDPEKVWSRDGSHGSEPLLGATFEKGARTAGTKLPVNFDAREQWKGCAGAIRYQGDCGACWSFSSMEMLAFRFCIEADVHVTLSVQEPLSCAAPKESDCSGGHPLDALAFAKNTGVVADKCMPYQDVDAFTNTVQCPSDLSQCTYPQKYDDASTWHASKYYKLMGDSYEETVQNMMTEIYKNGPIVVGMYASKPFENEYQAGQVWQKCTPSAQPDHAVLVLGWGNDPKQGPYWLLQNSWGKEWGDNGYFKLARAEGKDCAITTLAYAGDADTTRMPSSQPSQKPLGPSNEPNPQPGQLHAICGQDIACAEPLHCIHSVETGEPRCQPLPNRQPTPRPTAQPARQGEICGQDRGCEQGLFCIHTVTAEDARCERVPATDPIGTCGPYQPCPEDFSCVLTPPSNEARCMRRFPERNNSGPGRISHIRGQRGDVCDNFTHPCAAGLDCLDLGSGPYCYQPVDSPEGRMNLAFAGRRWL